MTRTKPNETPESPRPEPTLYARVMKYLRGITPRNLWFLLGVMAIGITFTVYASLHLKENVEAAALNEFDFICNEIQLNITDRLASNAQILHSSAAFFEASEIVSRAEWRTFTGNLRLEQLLPGTQGIGFSLLIMPGQLDEHIREIRAEGFPDYTVLPAGEREIYSSIIYLEPFSGRNLRAFGYDMFSEPVRRAAMEQARDEDTAVLSGKVILVQETDQDVQAGTLMYVPVYRPGMLHETVGQRRAAIMGWVYSPYRMNNLMRGTLRGWDVKQLDRQIYLQVYDGDVVSPDTLLYDSHTPQDEALDSGQVLSKQVPLDVIGSHWTLQFTQGGGLASAADYSGAWLVFIGGLGVNLLIFGLAVSLLTTRLNARRITELNVELKKLADTDGLTGIHNHRSLLKLAEHEFQIAMRYRQPLSMMFFDVDNFKKVNDTFGHAMGDQALIQTLKIICATLRTTDVVGRYGGDEFVILLPQTSAQEALSLAERIRTSIADMRLDTDKGQLTLEVSIGIAQSIDSALQPDTVESLLSRADQALYAAKQSGRNCIRIFEPHKKGGN
jgi:diguanylate cyclase (GGDEF)-like protein